jgi:prepilin-type N-terminal cleavage/methylation domain-containing protein
MAVHKARGLTLVEVIITLAILLVSVVIFTYSTVAFRNLGTSQSDTVAVNFGRTYLETLKTSWASNGYTTATLPVIDAPTGLKYKVFVKTAKKTSTDTEKDVARCGSVTPTDTSCSGSVLWASSTAADLNWSLRNVQIEVTDSKDRVRRLSSLIARAAF